MKCARMYVRSNRMKSIFFNALLQDIRVIYDQNKQIQSIPTTKSGCITYSHSQLKFQASSTANALK